MKEGERTRTNRATILEACFAVIKCMVGPAALYMPHGFAEAGLGLSLVIVAVANGLFVLGVIKLLDCWLYEAERTGKGLDAMQLATKLGGKFCGFMVEFSVVSLQTGVCVTYFIFVAETLGDVWPGLSIPATMVLMTILEAPASTVRNLHSLAAANVFGTFLVLTSLVIIAGFSVRDLLKRGPAPDWLLVKPSYSAVVFCGIAVFAFEGGASIIIPVANSVSESDRKHLKNAVVACVVAVAVLYALFAGVVYVAQGSDVDVIASKSLEKENYLWPNKLVNLVYLLVVLLSFPLQLLPATQILFPDVVDNDNDQLDNAAAATATSTTTTTRAAPSASLDADPAFSPLVQPDALVISSLRQQQDASTTTTFSTRRRRDQRKGDCRRVSLVVALALIALLGRHSLDHVVALLGAVSCGPLALCVGPYMHLQINPSPSGRVFDRLLIASGIAVTVLTLAVTLASWKSAAS